MKTRLLLALACTSCSTTNYIAGEGPSGVVTAGSSRWFIAGRVVERCVEADRPREGVAVAVESAEGAHLGDGRTAPDGTFHLVLGHVDGPKIIHVGAASMVASADDDLDLRVSFACPSGPNVIIEDTGIVEARVVKGDTRGPGLWRPAHSATDPQRGDALPVLIVR